ncbi:DUF4377 domain-containing protein [Burkholderia guangdongensis]|uniref:DUF4377 domain-containing protein n=1 Tax=Burkholderia guangdongensis TaxID=1792500 RepID=UPI0015CDDE44|nr:DUF4377 domain-containing protein [Burkholderia guangdongensis]
MPRTRHMLLAAALTGAAGLVGTQTAIGATSTTSTASTAPATPVAALPADGQPVTKIVYVAPRKAHCVGVAPMECLKVRGRTDEPWSLWYTGIDGFDFRPGYRYVLEVDEYAVAQPPADGSSVRWVLKRIVRRERAK